MIQGFFFFPLPLLNRVHRITLTMLHPVMEVTGDGSGHLGREKKTPRENFVGFSCLQTNPLSVALRVSEEVLEVGCG